MATGKEIEGNDDTSELRIPNYSQTRPNPTTVDAIMDWLFESWICQTLLLLVPKIWIFFHGWWTVNFRLTTSSLYLVSLKNLAHFEKVKNLLKTFILRSKRRPSWLLVLTTSCVLIHSLLNAAEPLFRGHPREHGKCPLNRGIPWTLNGRAGVC